MDDPAALASLQGRQGTFHMIDGGRGHGDHIHLRQEGRHVVKALGVVPSSDLVSADLIGVENPGQLDIGCIGILPCVIAAKHTGPHDACSQDP